MPLITDISPELLRSRHGLTSYQVERILGRVIFPEDRAERVSALEKVAEFIRLTDELRGAGVSFIPLKGPVLSYRLYGDATARHYGDLDILVGSESVTEAGRVLESLGYVADPPGWPAERRRRLILLKHSRDIAFSNPATGIQVELHWRLLRNLPGRVGQDEALFRGNQTELDFAGRTFSVLSNEAELLFLVIHGGLHWWRRLMWLVDIRDFLLAQPVDRDKFLELTGSCQASRMVALCNAMLAEFFPDGPWLPGSQPATPFLVRFSLKMIRSQKEPDAEFYPRIFQAVRFALFAFPGSGYKFRTIRNYLFVPSLFGRKSLLNTLPLFYFYGPARLAVKRLKG